MMSRTFALSVIAVAGWASLTAPAFAAPDRAVSVTWAQGKRLQIPVSAGSPLTVVIGKGERVLNWSVSDPASVEVTGTSGQDAVIVRSLRPIQSAWVSVLTDGRSYEFNLIDTPSASPVYMVEVSAPAAGDVAAAQGASYRIKGERALRPEAISDDGVHMYIRWRADQLIPAVFAVNAVGGEEMVDGYMREDVFTIDRIHAKLVFRIDRKSASATRQISAKKP